MVASNYIATGAGGTGGGGGGGGGRGGARRGGPSVRAGGRTYRTLSAINSDIRAQRARARGATSANTRRGANRRIASLQAAADNLRSQRGR